MAEKLTQLESRFLPISSLDHDIEIAVDRALPNRNVSLSLSLSLPTWYYVKIKRNACMCAREQFTYTRRVRFVEVALKWAPVLFHGYIRCTTVRSGQQKSIRSWIMASTRLLVSNDH